MSKNNKKYKVTNWREYNASLKKRGSLTIWLSEDFDKSWLAVREEKQARGRPLLYSDTSMNLMLTLMHLFKLALRQLTGFIESLFVLIGRVLPIPEFSRLSKRMNRSLSALHLPSLEGASHLVIDSTGLKVFGEKEWLETKHGKQYQRKVWRKLHIGVGKQGIIVAREMTNHLTDDRACVPSLLNQAGAQDVGDLLADRGYDSHQIHNYLANKKIKPIIPPPRHAVILSANNPSLRNQTIDYIKKKGYWAWCNKNDYGRRNKVENTFYRLKTIFGRKILSRNWSNQNAETQLICHLLNKMTELGIPKTVKSI
jgi:transposase